MFDSNLNFNLRRAARDGRYFDPVRRHYFRTENLFVVAPECGNPIPNQVLPKEGRYFDSWDRHYYKIGHLFGIDDKCPCGRNHPVFSHNRPFNHIDSNLNLNLNKTCCSDPNKCDDIVYNARDCFYYKIRAR